MYVLFCPYRHQAQMELRDRRVWSLRDLLGVAGEPPTSAGDGSTEVESWYTGKQSPTHPTMVGSIKTFDPATGEGLPKWLEPEEATALRRSIAAATRGANPTLTWEGPVLCGVQLKMTLENKQELPNSPRRYVLVTLRAKRRPHQPLSADHVKVLVQMDEGDRAYFAACVCFFVDSAGSLFVALRWLAEVPGVVVDPESELVPLKQTPVGATASYSVLPAAVIANGALVLQAQGKMWACLSPRETADYIASNYSNAGV